MILDKDLESELWDLYKMNIEYKKKVKDETFTNKKVIIREDFNYTFIQGKGKGKKTASKFRQLYAITSTPTEI